jgi:hypothetical protein
MTAEQHRALTELAETMEQLAAAQREVARLEKVRDRRVMRAVAVGLDKVTVAPVARLSRQRVGQIAAGVEKGAGKGQVSVLAKTGTPRGSEGVEARRALLAGEA